MKSLVDLLCLIISDVEMVAGANLSRDVTTLRERVAHEGDSFITITLPVFCQDFERCLDNGRVGPGAWASFRKLKSGIPAFLQGLLSNVFDPSGNLRSYVSVDCVRAVRQICLFGKKVEDTCSDTRSLAAADAFVQCDSEIVKPNDQLWRWYGMCCDFVVADMPHIQDVVFDLLRPRHGPGKTREGISGNQKWVFRRWHRRLEESGFTIRRFARGSPSDPHPDEGYVPPVLVEPGDEQPVRVCFVPKTQKSPRVIAIEPVCMQYAQQALKAILVEGIDNSPYTKGRVNFTDQGVNQKWARIGSQGGNYATLDMSEASDRVGLWHAERLFAKAPVFWSLCEAARTRRAELPDGRVIDLRKFASMGSALCFPVESLVFFVSIIASRLWRAGRFPTSENVRSYARSVFVYGDDLIIPADEASTTSVDLESLGFKVNRRKSFWNGNFRESCGLDAFLGECVTPTYFRRRLPNSRGDVSRLLSCVATGNQLYHAGYHRTATAIREAVERCTGSLPVILDDTLLRSLMSRRRSRQEGPRSAAIGWTWGESAPRRTRWNRFLQRTETYAWVASQADQPDSISGDAALAKAFLMCGSSFLASPLDDLSAAREDHLEVSSRPYALKLKRRWVHF